MRVGIVHEVEHEDVVLLRVRAVEPREGLDGLDAGERLVDVHRVQQRLVVAGLELVGADQEAVGVLLDLVGDLAAGEAVERASVTFSPPNSCSPEKATMAWYGLLRSFR